MVYDKTAANDSYNVAGNDILAEHFPVLHKNRVKELNKFRKYQK